MSPWDDGDHIYDKVLLNNEQIKGSKLFKQ